MNQTHARWWLLIPTWMLRYPARLDWLTFPIYQGNSQDVGHLERLSSPPRMCINLEHLPLMLKDEDILRNSWKKKDSKQKNNVPVITPQSHWLCGPRFNYLSHHFLRNVSKYKYTNETLCSSWMSMILFCFFPSLSKHRRCLRVSSLAVWLWWDRLV